MIITRASRGEALRAGRSATRTTRVIRLAVAVGIAFFALFAGTTARAQNFYVIYNFGGLSGEVPGGGLIGDSSGNLYGTTKGGGDYGYGTVFQLPTTGGETVFYSFKGGADGSNPYLMSSFPPSGGVVYGSAPYGGKSTTTCELGGCGVIFGVGSDGRERVLYSFTGGADGSYPNSPLIHDSAGNLYGAAALGGDFTGPCITYGCGVIFKLSRTGQETVLYSFSGGLDGFQPGPGLVRDTAGNLYGSTAGGGAYDWGVVFKLDPAGNETVLYSFTGGSDGAVPTYLVPDSSGNLYGTTYSGGNGPCPGGCGVVFKLDPTGSETVLYTFSGGTDGAYPYGGIVRDARGNLYSTTTEGGSQTVCGSLGCGVVFRVSPTGTETVLHTFVATDGAYPAGNLVVYHGYLYGTTQSGGPFGSLSGVAYQVSP